MLVCALNNILFTPGWPLWKVFKQVCLSVTGKKNLQVSSMVRCSLNGQKGFRILGSFLHPFSGQPCIIYCMRSWRVVSSLFALLIVCTCTLINSVISLWMVTSKPLNSTFSCELTLLSISAIGASGHERYLIQRSLASTFKRSFCSLGDVPYILKRFMVTLEYECSAIKIVVKLHTTKTTANISHSPLVYLVSAGVKLLEASATGLSLPLESFFISSAPNLTLHT